MQTFISVIDISMDFRSLKRRRLSCKTSLTAKSEESLVYSHYFKLHRSYSISLNMTNLGEIFLWDSIYRHLS